MKTVQFTAMKEGTKEDYLHLNKFEIEHAQGLPDRILQSLIILGDSLEGYKISRLEHSLQTATRAFRDNASDEMIVGALLHDIGDVLCPYNHGDYAGTVLRPFVSEKTAWIVEHHDIFQKYYYGHHLGYDRHEREKYKDNPHYEDTIAFCENWDQCSFDPDYKSLPLEEFIPLVKKIFSGLSK